MALLIGFAKRSSIIIIVVIISCIVYAVMGHRSPSKRRGIFSSMDDELDNAIPQFTRPQAHRPSLSVITSSAQLSDFDGRRHVPPGSLFPLRPRHRPPSSAPDNNPRFPLISAGDDDSVGGQALLHQFLTFLDLKGANYTQVLFSCFCC